MRSYLRRNTAALALLVAFAACGEDTAEPKVEGGQMTARIDGQAWTASITMAVRSSAGGIISVSGSDPSNRALGFAFIDAGTLTDERIAGTFEFTLHPANANTTGTRVVTQGKFDVEFTHQ